MSTERPYTEETRHRFGGDYRSRQALMLDKDGTMAPAKPRNKRSLVPSEPGGIINKKNPNLEFGVTAVEMSGRPAAATQRLQMMDSGWKFCNYDDWDLAPRFRELWRRSGDGKIVTDSGGNFSMALMWCPRDLIEARRQRHREWSSEVEKTYEERLAETVDKFDTITHQKDTKRLLEEAIERNLEATDTAFRRGSR